MSLTNPNKVITEERLSEFYQGILPYLGGMPEIYANTFSKSDLYSTDEKIVGQWIDGKPLYQKIFTGTVAAGASSDILFTDIIPNIESLVFYHAKGKRHDMTGYVQIPLINGSGTTMFSAEFKGMGTDASIGTKSRVTFIAGSGSTAMDYMMILKYTKTSDGVTSIGNTTDYSTTEKIVGTWINGKPLYQKTINCGALKNNAENNVDHNISNVDMIFIVGGFAMNPTNGSSIPIIYYDVLYPTYSVRTYVNRTKVQTRTAQNMSEYSQSYVTVQYTKTTD